MHKDFEAQVALVTGGSRGIGRAAVVRLAEGGAKVAIAYAGNDAAAQEAQAAAEKAGAPAAQLIKFDVADPAACARAVDDVVGKFGALHVLVNNAGSAREVAEAIAFLASDRAAFITGEVLRVNGGLYM